VELERRKAEEESMSSLSRGGHHPILKRLLKYFFELLEQNKLSRSLEWIFLPKVNRPYKRDWQKTNWEREDRSSPHSIS
jgi:hypothetical protein